MLVYEKSLKILLVLFGFPQRVSSFRFLHFLPELLRTLVQAATARSLRLL
jgi:hypothetical protein